MMSIRAYARHRRCDESTVRQALAEGRITADPTGDIDPVAADRDWAANSAKAGKAPGSLAAARLRQSSARLVKLECEVAGLRDGLVAPATAQRLVDEELEPVIEAVRGFPSAVAPLAAGLPPADAERVLRDKVIAMLTRLSAGEPATFSALSHQPTPATAVDVEQRRVTLRAEKLELENAARGGELVRIDRILATLADRCVRMRSAMLDLPGRIAHRFAEVPVEEAERMIDTEISSAIAELTLPPIVRALQQ